MIYFVNLGFKSNGDLTSQILGQQGFQKHHSSLKHTPTSVLLLHDAQTNYHADYTFFFKINMSVMASPKVKSLKH